MKIKTLLIIIGFIFCTSLVYAGSPPPGFIYNSDTGNYEPIIDGAGLTVEGSVSVKSTAHGSISTGTVTLTPGVHTITVAGNQTWAFSGWPASGTEGKMTIYVTNGGSATITGLAGPIFSGGGEPSLTSSGRDVLVFTTTDGGTTIWGFVSGLDVQ